MKLVTVQYEDTVDITALAKGVSVDIVGTNPPSLITGGRIMAISDVQDPEPPKLSGAYIITSVPVP